MGVEEFPAEFDDTDELLAAVEFDDDEVVVAAEFDAGNCLMISVVCEISGAEYAEFD